MLTLSTCPYSENKLLISSVVTSGGALAKNRQAAGSRWSACVHDQQLRDSVLDNEAGRGVAQSVGLATLDINLFAKHAERFHVAAQERYNTSKYMNLLLRLDLCARHVRSRSSKGTQSTGSRAPNRQHPTGTYLALEIALKHV
jgi:hypothetical protein